MKNFEELENFIKENPKNWQDKLKKAPYNLKSVTQFPNNPNWYLLNYNNIFQFALIIVDSVLSPRYNQKWRNVICITNL